jgi:hypothetical protein
LKWFQSPLLLLVSLLLSHSTCTEFLSSGLYIIKPQLLSWSHFYLQDLQHLLKCMFLFYCYGLWYPIYYYYYYHHHHHRYLLHAGYLYIYSWEKTVSLGNTVLQLFFLYYLSCLYR